MVRWIFVLILSLAFLDSNEEACGQYYKSINKDGSISFSDNPTSSVLKKESDIKATGPQKELEKALSPGSGTTSDKESTPAVLRKPAEESSSRDLMKLSLPGKNWALEFNFRDFQFDETKSLPDLKGRKIMATNKRTDVILSVYLSPARQSLTHKELREYAWEGLKKLPFKKEDIKRYEMGQWAFLEYIIQEAREFKGIDQKNVFAYLVKGDTWIDYHLSKVSYTPSDEVLFKDFFASVKILDNFIPSSLDNLFYATFYYSNRNYEKAIVYYQRALEQERQTPRLQKKLWRVLIDNLGMAYGISGDLKNAKQTFEYGISKDPAYPMFYYNLASANAELNDLDQAILNLGTAARYKSNMIPGEGWPNPSKDSSFQRFLNDKKFIEAAKRFSQ